MSLKLWTSNYKYKAPTETKMWESDYIYKPYDEKYTKSVKLSDVIERPKKIKRAPVQPSEPHNFDKDTSVKKEDSKIKETKGIDFLDKKNTPLIKVTPIKQSGELGKPKTINPKTK